MQFLVFSVLTLFCDRFFFFLHENGRVNLLLVSIQFLYIHNDLKSITVSLYLKEIELLWLFHEVEFMKCFTFIVH